MERYHATEHGESQQMHLTAYGHQMPGQQPFAVVIVTLSRLDAQGMVIAESDRALRLEPADVRALGEWCRDWVLTFNNADNASSEQAQND